MKQVIETIDVKVDIEKIIEELKFNVLNYKNFYDQINLQTVKNYDPYYGSRNGNELKHTEEQFNHFYFDIPYTNSILHKYNLRRSRVMNLKSKTCLSYHSDPTKRFHIPLTTNDSCFFIINKEIYQLPANGNCYILDATLPHTAVNASYTDRMHIIGTII